MAGPGTCDPAAPGCHENWHHQILLHSLISVSCISTLPPPSLCFSHFCYGVQKRQFLDTRNPVAALHSGLFLLPWLQRLSLCDALLDQSVWTFFRLQDSIRGKRKSRFLMSSQPNLIDQHSGFQTGVWGPRGVLQWVVEGPQREKQGWLVVVINGKPS